MTQSNDTPLERLPQRIEDIAELLARSILAFDRRMEQMEIHAATEREQRASEYKRIQQLLSATAQANAENTQQISKLIEVERTHERRTSSLAEPLEQRIARSVMAVTSDVKETVISVKAIARALDRQNRELSDALRQQSRDFFDVLERHQDQIDTLISDSYQRIN
jgi:serine phosphatase RsbU (regulator of sigma subunit)